MCGGTIYWKFSITYIREKTKIKITSDPYYSLEELIEDLNKDIKMLLKDRRFISKVEIKQDVENLEGE